MSDNYHQEAIKNLDRDEQFYSSIGRFISEFSCQHGRLVSALKEFLAVDFVFFYVRYGAHCGPNSDIAPLPRWAISGPSASQQKAYYSITPSARPAQSLLLIPLEQEHKC